MKIASSNANHSSRMVMPPVPLIRPERKTLSSDEYLTLKLRTIPGNDRSPTYDMAVVYFDAGTAEEWFLFQENLHKAFLGLNLTAANDKVNMTRRLLKGAALAAFNTHLPSDPVVTDAQFDACMQEVTKSVLPMKALQAQKRYMRRYIRKPRDMKIRKYVNRVIQLNMYLALFPPFGTQQQLPEDELLDLLEWGIPASWQKDMNRQGFIPVEESLDKFVNFCERLESNEDENQATTGKRKRDKSNSSDKQSSKKSDKGQGKGTCDLHGYGHHTHECTVIKKLAQEVKDKRANKDANNSGKSNKKGGFQKKHKQELNAMVMKMVKEAIADSKPEPSKDEDVDMDQFNYEDFKDLELSEGEQE